MKYPNEIKGNLGSKKLNLLKKEGFHLKNK